jgi:TPR repeat protein
MRYGNVADAYIEGRGVEMDMEKAKQYYELAAAMKGHVIARHNLGCTEGQAGNMDRAMKHLMISAGAGYDDSLKAIRQCFMDGHAKEEGFEKALRAHEESLDEIKSDQRDAAAVFLQSRGAGFF